MRRLPIFWRLFLSYLPAVALALLVFFTGDYPRQDSANAVVWPAQSLAVGAVVLTAIAAGIGLVSSERISRSLQVMRASAEHFAVGDFSHRLRIPNTPEMGNLAATLNNMAAQLEDQISVVTQHRNEQDAILVSMQEGVLALDPQAHVIAMNPAAEALLAVPATQARGRTVQEVIRNVGLQRLLTDAMSKAEPTMGEIVLRGDEERFLQVTATALRDAAGRDLGMLVVLNDITQLRRLENIRRDFVANVSHELKTPITSIKGFVETLRDGALDDRPQAERFLEIVAPTRTACTPSSRICSACHGWSKVIRSPTFPVPRCNWDPSSRPCRPAFPACASRPTPRCWSRPSSIFWTTPLVTATPTARCG